MSASFSLHTLIGCRWVSSVEYSDWPFILTMPIYLLFLR